MTLADLASPPARRVYAQPPVFDPTETNATCAWHCATARERVRLAEAIEQPDAADAPAWRLLPVQTRDALRQLCRHGVPGVRDEIVAGFR